MRRASPALRLGGLVLAVAVAFAVVALSGSLSADRVRGLVDGYGILGPLIFIAIAGALNCVFFPGPLLAGAAGLLFGTVLGTPIAIVSSALSAVAAFTVARWLAGDAVEELGGRRVQSLAALVERRGFLAVLYVRLLPGVPYSLFNYAAGLTRISLATFAAATVLGTAPRTFAYVALGGSFGNFGRPETIVAIAILVTMAIGSVVVVRLRSPGSGRGSSSPDGRSATRP